MDIKLNADGDIDLGDNYTMKLCSLKQDLVRQRIQITLGVNRGSYDYDLGYGTPWLTNQYNNFSILGKIPKVVFDGELKQQILTREGVKSIVSFDTTVNPNTRIATTTAEVEIDSGEIVTISTSN